MTMIGRDGEKGSQTEMGDDKRHWDDLASPASHASRSKPTTRQANIAARSRHA